MSVQGSICSASTCFSFPSGSPSVLPHICSRYLGLGFAISAAQPWLRYPWANCQPSGAAAATDWRQDRLSCTNYMWSMSSLQEHAVARADADNESTFSQLVRCLSKKYPAFISWPDQLFLSTSSSAKRVPWFFNSWAGTFKWDSL